MHIYEEIFALASPYLQTRGNEIHIPVSRRFAEMLLQEEKGDPEIVIPAVLLHDVGWSKLSEAMQLKAFGPGNYDKDLNRIHEVEGVKIARGILEQVGYNSAQSEEILAIIDGHDSRLTPISGSDKIVKDSDKLFRFSAEGLAFYLARFGPDIPERLKWLQSKMDRWFFTTSARRIALQELERRFNEAEILR